MSSERQHGNDRGETIAEVFFVDHMLGRLARWVRFMGFHARYASPEMSDDEILNACRNESLILLSRDRELCSRTGRSMYIRSVKIDEQIEQFAEAYKPVLGSVMRICPVCDGNLESVEKEALKGAVPEKVLQNSTEFWKCVNCGKAYWNGTHYDRIIKRISELSG